MASTLEDLTIEPEHIPFTDRRLQGLKARNPEKMEYILTIERLWEEFAMAFDSEERQKRLDKLLKQLQFTIQKKAGALAQKWINKKISAEDFESEFWVTVWQLCEEKYSPFSPFYLYETFLLAIERKEIDVVRKYTKAKKRAFNTNSLPLLESASDWISNGEDIEKHITDRILVEQILRDGALTEQEMVILQIMYDNPNLSLRKIGEELGMHVEEVRRTLAKIKEKLRDYDYKFD